MKYSVLTICGHMTVEYGKQVLLHLIHCGLSGADESIERQAAGEALGG